MREDWDDYPKNQINKPWKEGYVYILDYGDMKTFKIGSTTKHPQQRFSQICGTNVIMPMHIVLTAEVWTNCYMVEQLLHMEWDEKHVQGEWFNFDFWQILDIYDLLEKMGFCAKMHDRWFDLVPKDYKKIVLEDRNLGNPYFTRQELEEGKTDLDFYQRFNEVFSDGPK